MTLFDLPLICTLLAVAPAYAFYTGDIELDCELRLMVFDATVREENWFGCVKDYGFIKPIIEYSEIPHRERPVPFTVGGYPPQRRLLNRRKPKTKRWS